MSAKDALPEKPMPLGDRVYKKHREMLKKQAKKEGVKTAEIVRRAIEKYCA